MLKIKKSHLYSHDCRLHYHFVFEYLFPKTGKLWLCNCMAGKMWLSSHRTGKCGSIALELVKCGIPFFNWQNVAFFSNTGKI